MTGKRRAMRAAGLIGAMLALLPAACAAPPACRLELASRVAFITLPLDARMMVPVSVDRRPARMLLDTGADTTVLTDAAFRRLSGLEQAEHERTIAGIGGTQIVQGVQMWRFAVGRLASELSVVVLDHSILPPIPPTDGLLGMDALTGYDVDLDVAGGALGLYRAGGDCSAPRSILAGTAYSVALLPAVSDRFEPRFVVMVNGQRLVAEIDTGAPNTVMSDTVAARLGLVVAPGVRRLSGVAYGGIEVRDAVVGRLKVGPLNLHDMPATVVHQNLVEPVDLLLGADFIHIVHVWISASSQALVLQYPPLATPRS